MAPSPGLTSPVWSLLAPWSWGPPRHSSPLSRSCHILAFVRCELESPPCFLAHCGTPWLLAFRSGHCRIPAGLASMDRPLLVSSVESQLCECPFVVLPRQLVGSGVCSPALPICPTSSVLKRSSFKISASVFCVKSSRWGHPSGSSLSLSSIGMKSLPPPSWFWLESSRWGHPVGSSFSDLDRNEDSLHTFPSGWRQAFTMGSPVSGRVALF